MKTSEPEVFRALFREHHPRIRRYFAARAPASQVDDLAAETFLVAWRRFAEIPPQPLPWLLNVASKVQANQRRKTERAQALVERLASASRLDALDASAAAERRARHLAVLHALARLSESDRELMLLSLWDGLQGGEIALALGVNPVATRARLSRARRRLERALRAELEAAGEPAPRPSLERTTA
jgi:RNA polymerase sigma-70 factor, ECF subfamily